MGTLAGRLVGCMLVAAAAAIALPAGAQQPYSDGEVKSVDRDGRKVVLRTSEIRNIDMPPMTMPFVVRDAKMLDNLKAGDRVKFRAINDSGKFTITELVPAK